MVHISNYLENNNDELIKQYLSDSMDGNWKNGWNCYKTRLVDWERVSN